ncbi:MAG: flagellar hook-associated protein FlgK [Clostridium sp.]|nr:flagellar hook-associated protein FlgK [Clostridium sp.]
MAGLIGNLHSARTGMSVSQASIQTTSHNINNINTPGYSRQRVEQSAKSAYSNPGYNSSMGPGQIGTGVQATDVIRIRNTFYDFQYRSESHNYGQTSVKYQHYTTMESIFNEPSDTSISSSIANFFSGWQELSKNPTDLSAKDIVIQNSKYLATNISNVKEKLENLSSQAEKKLNDDVSEVNDMLDRLKELDKQINLIQGSGKTPNDLMDERDNILDDLSYKVDLNNTQVQDALKTGELKIEKTATGELNLTDANGKVIDKPSGEIQGSIDMVTNIGKYTEKITELAQGVAQGVNNILNGRDITSTVVDPDKDLFIIDTNGNPIIAVNDKIADDTKSWTITTDVANNVYKLKDQKFTIGKEETTIDKFYNGIIQTLGNETQEVIRSESNQGKVLKEIDNLRLNVSGVSIDEEMVNLIQFQHSYNASAKVISTIDSLLDVVVNGLVR